MLAVFHSNRASRLNPDYITLCNGQAQISEKAAAGAGTLSVALQTDALLLIGREKKGQIAWLKGKSCADAALLTICPRGTTIHVFEMKKTVSVGDLESILLQIEGMVQNVYALIGVLGLPSATHVCIYLALQTEKISPVGNPSLIGFKGQLGKPPTKRERLLAELLDNRMSILDLGPVPVTIIQRDAAGNAAHTL